MTHNMQSYMDKHRIGPLFEDLMNKLLRDTPDDPMVYLLRVIYKKSGLEMPQDLKAHAGGVRKSTDPELNRSYDKPWMSQTKKLKPKKSGEDIQMSKARKQRSEWNNDKKVKATSFDDMWEEHQPVPKETGVRHSEPAHSVKRGWAKVGLEDDGEVYSSHGYRGPYHNMENEDPLASEIIPVSYRDQETKQSMVSTRPSVRNVKMTSRQHRAQLEKMLHSSNKKDVDLGFGGDLDDENDDAIELLEDPNELANEGVTKISKSGYKLSKILRQRNEQTQVKLNIQPVVSSVRGYGDYPESSTYESEEERVRSPGTLYSTQHNKSQPPTLGQSGLESDDEFESVSQVAGPRKPVWSVPDSDGESFFAPRPGFTSPVPNKSPAKRKQKQRGLAATLPAGFGKPFSYTSGPLQPAGRDGLSTWAPGDGSDAERETAVPADNIRASIQSDQGRGWVLPDDSDASVTDYASRSKTYRMDPRAY
ncbi:uncharacterized protein C8orf34-like isoform X2 [Gigantopelta aegis]|uniref:uncharacterized protein C8orf34-like isoform X2 n=1 Tax=Gigantopelta aegis TaxID=1735272 RepID=UPI001B88BF52|nr:uncharacterized protein C8orf34-like isoform X2 [Gigantopelta aegis]